MQRVRLNGQNMNKGINIHKFRASKEWKKLRDEFIVSKGGVLAVCSLCGGCKKLTVHHNIECNSLEEYKNLKDNCILICQKCHYKLEIGYVICDMCKKNLHYWKYGSCWNCKQKYDKEVKESEEEMYRLEEKAFAEADALASSTK